MKVYDPEFQKRPLEEVDKYSFRGTENLQEKRVILEWAKKQTCKCGKTLRFLGTDLGDYGSHYAIFRCPGSRLCNFWRHVREIDLDVYDDRR